MYEYNIIINNLMSIVTGVTFFMGNTSLKRDFKKSLSLIYVYL